MVDFRRVEGLTLRITGQDGEHPLTEGVHGLARNGVGITLGAGQGDAMAYLCLDRRGVWLSLPSGTAGVHVNGRRVRRMAMLRPGDSIYLDGTELVLASEPSDEAPSDDLAGGPGDKGDVRVLLRGVGGQYHGRSVTLERPRLVGRSPDADIRVESEAVAERHAQLLLVNGRVLLRDLGTSSGSVLNGNRVHDAWVEPGDQLAFDPQHRFVVEAPGKGMAQEAADLEQEADALASEPRPVQASSWRRWPWLLLSALGIAAALAALLMWGSAA